MSAEPKRDLAEILDRLLPPGGLARTAARHSLMKELAGWVSPEEATAREAAARREALLEGDARRRELSRNLERATKLCRKAQAEALVQVERVARVETLVEEAQVDMDLTNAEVEAETGRPSTMRAFVLVGDLRAALAEPERDEESGR